MAAAQLVLTQQAVEGPQSSPADRVVASLDGVDDGKLHQGKEYEDGADQEPNVYPFDVDHPGHLVVDTLVEIDISQPAACPWYQSLQFLTSGNISSYQVSSSQE